MPIPKTKQKLWEQLQDDIKELSEDLQIILHEGLQKGTIIEEDIIAKIDDMESKAKMLEKFYNLTDKLSITVITIEEVLEKEIEQTEKNAKKE